MSAESPRHVRAGALTVAPQPPSDRTLIDTVSGFISDVRISSPSLDSRDTILWAKFHTADVNEPTSEERDAELSPLLLSLGYGSGVQVWLIPPTGEAQEVLSWRQGTVRVLRILPTPPSGDSFAAKRPLLAICDSAGQGPQYCSLSFLSIRGGEQVKSIKFKNPILDVLANKRSVVVAFSERFAVFDAGTLEDRLAVTSCYPCPCPLGGAGGVNPLALGDRWLAYADKKLNPTKRSSGGCEGEGVSSYTATVLHAAKSLSKGLRGLGESVASGLAGARAPPSGASPPNTEPHHAGVVSVIDIEGPSEEDVTDGEQCDSLVAHFAAHSDAIISLKFDASGMLLVTADKRGHDFHVFRIHPHPCGSSLASVHHLYILHRGDTTAKVQDISISTDSRWTAVSTLRGTTHVFPMSAYGGPCGVRTHTQPRVVNRLSRFQRSAGLPIQAAGARSSSPVGDGVAQGAWFPNPRLPPYPLPTVNTPLAQLRPSTTAAGIPTHTITRNSSGRQRLSSQSEDTGGVPLLACAQWGAVPPATPAPPGASSPPRAPAAQALYLMTATGHLLQYILHPRPSSGVTKEKVCDETPVELGVELVAQWPLTRLPDASTYIPANNPLHIRPAGKSCCDQGVSEEERWLAQVEMVTHAGPHRRLWMGPQFIFKTYNSTLCGSSSSLLEAEAVEVEVGGAGVARSPPVNIAGARPLVPVLIDSGSTSSLEHSPSDSFRRKSYMAEAGGKPVGDRGLGDVQLREDLAEAMRETEHGSGVQACEGARRGAAVTRAVDPLGTVVEPSECELPFCDDPDSYTSANTDETLFRPVVSAATCISSHLDLSTSPLPAGTRIPVENLTQTNPILPDDDFTPLESNVVIPAALTYLETPRIVTDDVMTCIQSKHEIISCEELPDKTFEFSINLVGEIKDELQENSDERKTDYIEICKDQTYTEPNTDIHKQERLEALTTVKETITIKRKSKKKDARISHEKIEVEIINETSEQVTSDTAKDKENEIEMSQSTIVDSKEPYETASKVEAQTDTMKSDYIDDSAKVEKTTTINKNKGKSRDRRSVTPRDDAKDNKKLDSDINNTQAVLKTQQIYTETELSEPIPSLRKSNKKSAKNIDNNKKTLGVKQDDDYESVQFNNVRLPSRKNSSSLIEENVQQEVCVNIDDYKSVNKSGNISVNPVKSEDQMWAMLTDTPNKMVLSEAEEPKHQQEDQSTKLVADKPKSKKSKKNKKIVAETVDANVNSLMKSQDNAKTCFEILSKEKENLFSDEKHEISTNDACTNESFDKYTQKSDEKPSVTDEISVDYVVDEYKFNASNAITRESTLKKVEEARKESFDLSIDFDAYLMTKNNNEENPASEQKYEKKKDVLQELFGNTAFTLQPTKSRKHSRKDRSRNEDSVENSAEAQKYGSTAVKVDKEIHSKPRAESHLVVGSLVDEFPSIGSSHRSHKKRCITPSSNPPLAVKSYSSVTAVSKPEYEETSGMELSDILDPPMPCRTAIHEKLAEICKRTDIAVAECGSPDKYDESSSESDLPPMEFSLDEFKMDIVRESLIDTCDRFVDHDIHADVVLFKSYRDQGELASEDAMQECADEPSADLTTSVTETQQENIEKCWDDGNVSPVTSQTDSDKDDKKPTTADPALNTPRNNKKKPRHKRKK